MENLEEKVKKMKANPELSSLDDAIRLYKQLSREMGKTLIERSQIKEEV